MRASFVCVCVCVRASFVCRVNIGRVCACEFLLRANFVCVCVRANFVFVCVRPSFLCEFS